MKGKKQQMMRRSLAILVTLTLAAGISACQNRQEEKKTEKKEDVTVSVLAAASMTDVLDDLRARYEKKHPEVTLQFSYESSGTLKTQIEQGVGADLFISAATKQMDELKASEKVDADTIVNLLENKVVMIAPKGERGSVTSFEDMAADNVSMVAIGNSDVPVGQYTQEIYENLGLWDSILEKANLATNVRQVLDWVATENAPYGIVYATDAMIEDQVEIICEAPEGTCEQAIYPAGIVSASTKKDETRAFLTYLQSEEASTVFEEYGFTPMVHE